MPPLSLWEQANSCPSAILVKEIDCIKELSPLWSPGGGEHLFSNKIEHPLIDLTACRLLLCQPDRKTVCLGEGLKQFHLSPRYNVP